MGIAVFFLVFLLFVFPVVVFADMGPKPSIDIMFENLNQRIYVTLLSEDKSTGPYSVFDEEHETLDDVLKHSVMVLKKKIIFGLSNTRIKTVFIF